MILYHGTNTKRLPSIKKQGKVKKMSFIQKIQSQYQVNAKPDFDWKAYIKKNLPLMPNKKEADPKEGVIIDMEEFIKFCKKLGLKSVEKFSKFENGCKNDEGYGFTYDSKAKVLSPWES